MTLDKKVADRVAILGLGLIGGSLGMALRRARAVGQVVGADTADGIGPAARAAGAVDTDSGSIRDAVKNADLVVLAAPPGQLAALVDQIRNDLASGATVTDVGSVKGTLVAGLQSRLPAGVAFVGGHPLAGRERSGIGAARADLFEGARCLLTPLPRTDAAALERVRRMWEAVGAIVSLIDPEAHDRILAAVSHLPHLVAYALVNTVLDLDDRGENLVAYSAGGFRDFSRIAASSPELWRDVCLMNATEIVRAIETYQKELEQLKQMITERDGPGLVRRFSRAREVRQKIHGGAD